MHEDRWLSARFGHPVFTVADVREAADIPDDRGASYQAKVDTDRVADVTALERSGFSVVDVNVTLARPGEAFPADDRVADAGPGDRDELIRIAAEDYDVSRFHLDPGIPERVASAIKRDWITACLDGERGERVLAASVDGAPAGFLAVLAGEGTRVIDLVAVSAEERGAGLGVALVRRFLTLCAEAGARGEVGSQVSNTGALRLYEELGFRTVGTRYVLHRHVQPSWGAR